MINLTRGEPFAFQLCFGEELGTPRSCALLLAQGGHTKLIRRGRDTAEDGCVFLLLTGEETARFQTCAPAYAQVRAVLEDGTELYSQAAELNIVDTLHGRKGGAWKTD